MASASRALPLGLSRQAKFSSGACAEPLAVADCLVPRHSHHGLLGVVECRIPPERWRRQRRCGLPQKMPVVGIGDLARGEQKFVNPDAMYGLFVLLPGIATHEEPSRGDADERGNVFPGSRMGEQLRCLRRFRCSHGFRAPAACGRRLRFYAPGTSGCRQCQPLPLPGTTPRSLS